MDLSKKIYNTLGNTCIFLYLLSLPFGQLTRVVVSVGDLSIPIVLSDIIVGISVPLLFIKDTKRPRIFGVLFSFVLVAFFSLVNSLILFSVKEVLWGSFYLIRLSAYFSFFVLVWNLVRRRKIQRMLLFEGLILGSVFSAIFGWIQYIWVPDLTWLKYFGWDDHLYRLVGTFLDPGFTAIILVFGALLSFFKFMKTRKVRDFMLVVFLLVSSTFTYSRSTLLALFFALVFILFKEKALKAFPLIILFFILILLLPRPQGEGVRIERVASVNARLQNYSQTLTLIKQSPLFGVGYNNLCKIRLKTFSGKPESHACGGSDSSLLFITATTGIVGLLTFIYLVYRIVKSLRNDLYGKSFLVSSIFLLINSFFINSVFYPWVLGYMMILLAIGIRE